MTNHSHNHETEPHDHSMFEFLTKVELFQGLSHEDLDHLSEDIEQLDLERGEVLFEEGSFGDKAYIIETGELEVLKESSGRDVLLAVRGPGEVIGEIALLEDAPRSATVRARSDTTLCVIHKELVDHLIQNSLSAARSMFYTVLERLRSTEVLLRQSERMAQLGTLTAGVAHELNNPAAAVARGAGDLQGMVEKLAGTQSDLACMNLTDTQQSAIDTLVAEAREKSKQPQIMDALTRSDLEYEIEDWLDDQGVEDPWEYTSPLVSMGYSPDELGKMAGSFEGDQLPAVINWVSTNYSVHTLLNEVGQGVGRITDIVKALKSYSYLDQAPVQSVDLHEGLDNTLLILRNKIKQGVSINREYDENLPHIQAYGSELNQVWTNILDNAIDAMEGSGTITLRTRREGDDWVVVGIEDTGPGIPEDIQHQVFDSFFTTKPPGKGTGLGLNISYNIIVEKHRGDIKLDSRPGSTCFDVWLPVSLDAD